MADSRTISCRSGQPHCVGRSGQPELSCCRWRCAVSRSCEADAAGPSALQPDQRLWAHGEHYFSCCYSVRPEGLQQSVPIGYPISNSRAYVLDERLEPVPQGVTGELYVAGAGLARGYLNRAAFTAERFVPDPYGRPGTRMYRTGDLVRRNAQGALEFQGRIDQQVKIRGFRVEPSEIEFALGQIDGVSQCAVLAHQKGGETHLVAYVAPENGRALNVTDLEAVMRESLPSYMTPSDFVVLETLPLTVNGKIGRAHV